MFKCTLCDCEIDEDDVLSECPFCGETDATDGVWQCPDCEAYIDYKGEEWECIICGCSQLNYQENQEDDEEDEEDDEVYASTWRCPNCGAYNPSGAEVCEECWGSADVNFGSIDNL